MSAPSPISSGSSPGAPKAAPSPPSSVRVRASASESISSSAAARSASTGSRPSWAAPTTVRRMASLLNEAVTPSVRVAAARSASGLSRPAATRGAP